MWRTVKLGDALKTGAGGTPLKSKKEYYEGGNIKWLLSGAVCERDIHDSKTHISEDGLANSSAKIFPKDSVLVAMYGATAGQVGILRTEAATNQAVCGIYPSSDYLPEFLYYYLTNYKETLLLEVSGVAQPNLSQKKIKNIPLPLITLAEQQRIVAKLDAAFAEIDGAIEAGRHSALLNEKLFSNTLEQLFDKIRLQNGSVELGKVSAKIQDGAHHSPKNVFDEKSDNQFPYVTSKNIRTNYMKLDTLKYVDVDFHDSIYPRCDAKIGDVLLTKDGASTGNICLNELDEPASLLSSVCLIRGIENQILNEYICFYLQSPTGFQAVTGSMTGAAIKRIILKTIKKTPVPLPSIEEQKKLCKTTEKLLKITGNIAEIYANKIRNYEALKSAILAQELQSEAA